jgi:hypothetical protein
MGENMTAQQRCRASICSACPDLLSMRGPQQAIPNGARLGCMTSEMQLSIAPWQLPCPESSQLPLVPHRRTLFRQRCNRSRLRIRSVCANGQILCSGAMGVKVKVNDI